MSIPGTNGTPIQLNEGLPSGVPVGGLFTDDAGKVVGGTGVNAIQAFIVLTIIVAIIVAFWFIFKGGWDMITSRGIKEKFQKSRERVFYALFGLFMIFIAFLMLSAGSALFGYDLLPFLKFR